MDNFIDFEGSRHAHPVDMIEWVAASREWTFERSCEDEIALTVAGVWSDYAVSFSWIEGLEALHVGCAFDLKVPLHRRDEVLRLLARINEAMVIGHFDYWESAGAVMYRNSLLLSGGAEATSGQAERMLGHGIEQCERFYQAFQFVVWADKKAEEAMAASMFETVGQA